MEIGLALLLFVCMTALLYVLLSLKITRQVDAQMKEFYKTRIHADMQEFYRVMESYAAMFETRIQNFRTLIERNESIAKTEDYPQPIKAAITEKHEVRAPEKVVAKKTAQPAAKIVDLGKAGRSGKAKLKSKKLPHKPVKLTRAAAETRAKAVAVMPNTPPTFAAQASAILSPQYQSESATYEDSAIAEELMKDLFAQDEVNIKHNRKEVAADVAPTQIETPGEKTMANFLSRLGKAIEPIVFGEKKTDENREQPAPVKQQAEIIAAPRSEKTNTDFSEVLRRAEQIKAEKKAERERSEVEARAEFYAGGDSFENKRAAQTAPVSPRVMPTPAESMPAKSFARRPEVMAVPTSSLSATATRNTLAVKELDEHMVNFLIDSLSNDNGYRKQTLRTLIENNIPLADIARLSKIDLGELELMRQLGRF